MDAVEHAKGNPRFGLQGVGEAALIALLVATGLFAWTLRMREPLQVDTRPLGALPTRIGGLAAEDLPLESAVEEELRADLNLLRAYVGPDRHPLVLYVGYYGTARGGRPEHTPRGCYTGAGWGIESARIVDVGGAGGLRANEWIVEREGERQLVLFWFRSFRQTGLLGGLDLSLDKLVGRLVHGRADGALVRVSAPLAGDEDAVRSRLRPFALAVDAQLEAHWPYEHAPAA
jgi:EpsI family protein